MKSVLLSIHRSIGSKWVLVIVLLLAAGLRLWNLGNIPPGLTPDEASLGYNAFSILNTGRDEYGKLFPVVFKSFGDYKPGLYVYLTIPTIAVFGLSEFSVRLPSAVAGIVTVYLIFLIIKKLAVGKSMENGIWKPEYIGAFVAGINPYLIYFSRGAWEANVSLTLTLAGIYFFLNALAKSKYLIYSALFFALTLITYQGAKMSTTIVLLLLVLIYWIEFRKINFKTMAISVFFGFVISLPVILTLFNGQTQRLTIFSIFSYPRPASEIQQYAGPLFQIFHSGGLNYVRMILSRWFNFYSGNFLFFAGDIANPVHTPPYQGVLLIVDLLLLPVGIFSILKHRLEKGYIFIFLWLVFAPFSAAITRDQTNAVRSLNTAIPLVITITLGLKSIIDWIINIKYPVTYFFLLSLFYLLGIIYFLDAYFVHLPNHNSQYSRYGYKQAVGYVNKVSKSYDHIIVEQSFNQPYIYFLFFTKYDPYKWQQQARLVDSQYVGDVGFEEKLDNIYFKNLDWNQIKNDNNVLIVAETIHIPPEVKSNTTDFPSVKEIKYLNSDIPAFDIYSKKNEK